MVAVDNVIRYWLPLTVTKLVVPAGNPEVDGVMES